MTAMNSGAGSRFPAAARSPATFFEMELSIPPSMWMSDTTVKTTGE